jgi:undecaprenyl-diphosphatase
MIQLEAPASGRIAVNQAKIAVLVAVLLMVSSIVAVSAIASQYAYTDLDLRIAGWVQALQIPGLDGLSGFVSFATAGPMAVALWMVAGAFLVLRGRPLEAIAVFLISGLWVGNEVLGFIVDRPVPAQDILGTVGSSLNIGGFPSGHVTGAVAFYGLIAFLVVSNARGTGTRIIVPVLAAAMIGAASLSMVYVGAHWPSDILGSYLVGTAGVVAIAWFYTSVKEDRFHLPRLHKKQPPQPVDGVIVTGSIASKVVLDLRAGTATKEYRPPWPVRALYWVAFQAPFPYRARKDALLAGAAKRKIAGLLTEHRFGADMVAPVLDIRQREDGAYEFVTELVPGREPESNSEVEGVLTELYAFFRQTGLPTWQIAPGNPHAYSNFIRNPQGELKLIDLESAIVSVSYPWRELLAALRDGNFPVFDDVDFVQLRGYVSEHGAELARTLGPAKLAELNEAIDVAEMETESWKQSEPRIWGRIGRSVYRILAVGRHVAGIGRRLEGAEAMATAFLSSAVDRWETEGKIDAQRAHSLRSSLASPEVQRLMKHLGAHLVLSLVLRFPVGSLARFGWVVSFRVRARVDRARGRITREQYREARSIHSVPVMMLSLVPGPGFVAYLASSVLRKSGLARLLIDQSAHKLPFSLYRRLGVARLTAPRMPKPEPYRPGLPKRVATGVRLAYQWLV